MGEPVYETENVTGSVLNSGPPLLLGSSKQPTVDEVKSSVSGPTAPGSPGGMTGAALEVGKLTVVEKTLLVGVMNVEVATREELGEVANVDGVTTGVAADDVDATAVELAMLL